MKKLFNAQDWSPGRQDFQKRLAAFWRLAMRLGRGGRTAAANWLMLIAFLWMIDVPTLRMEPGLIDGRVVALLLFAMTFIAYWFNRWPTNAANQAIDGPNRWWRMPIAAANWIGKRSLWVLLSLTLVVVGVRLTQGRGYFMVDGPNINTSAFVEEILREAVALKTRYPGYEFTYDSREIEQIVDDARSGINKAVLTRFRAAINNLTTLKERIATIAKTTERERGIIVVCCSGHRRGASSREHWPLDPARCYSRWICVNPAAKGQASDRPQIVRVAATHDPSIAFELALEMVIPKSFSQPLVRVELYSDKSTKPLEVVSFDPTKGEPGKQIGSDPDRERLSYRFRLPRKGDYMRIRFEGPEWQDMNKVPEIAEPIRWKNLRLVARLDANLSALAAFTPLSAAHHGGDDYTPIHFKPTPSDPEQVSIELGSADKLTDLPSDNRPVVRVIPGTYANGAPQVRSLFRMPEARNLGRLYYVWPDDAVVRGYPGFEWNGILPSEADVYLALEPNAGAPLLPIAFRPSPQLRPNYWVLTIPPLTDLQTLTTSQQAGVAHSLVWTTSLAALSGAHHEPITEHVVLRSDTKEFAHSGVEPKRVMLAKQLWQVLWTGADQTRSGSAANNVAGQILRPSQFIILTILVGLCGCQGTFLWRRLGRRNG